MDISTVPKQQTMDQLNCYQMQLQMGQWLSYLIMKENVIYSLKNLFNSATKPTTGTRVLQEIVSAHFPRLHMLKAKRRCFEGK